MFLIFKPTTEPKTVFYCFIFTVMWWQNVDKLDLCCVSVQDLHPSEEHLKANYVTTQREVCPSLKLLQMLLLLPVSGGRTATILRGLTYPKILCVPEKEERKRENGDIAHLVCVIIMYTTYEMYKHVASSHSPSLLNADAVCCCWWHKEVSWRCFCFH